jgi:hypothetical protein
VREGSAHDRPPDDVCRAKSGEALAPSSHEDRPVLANAKTALATDGAQRMNQVACKRHDALLAALAMEQHLVRLLEAEIDGVYAESLGDTRARACEKEKQSAVATPLPRFLIWSCE